MYDSQRRSCNAQIRLLTDVFLPLGAALGPCLPGLAMSLLPGVRIPTVAERERHSLHAHTHTHTHIYIYMFTHTHTHTPTHPHTQGYHKNGSSRDQDLALTGLFVPSYGLDWLVLALTGLFIPSSGRASSGLAMSLLPGVRLPPRYQTSSILGADARFLWDMVAK